MLCFFFFEVSAYAWITNSAFDFIIFYGRKVVILLVLWRFIEQITSSFKRQERKPKTSKGKKAIFTQIN